MFTIASLSHPAAKSMMSLQSKGANHSRAFLIALGYTLGNSLSLSSEAEQDVNGYYRMVHSGTVRSILSDINEFLPFSVREAEDLVKSFYSYRHKAMRLADIPMAFNQETGLVDFFALSSVFSKCTLDEIGCNSAKISELIALLQPVCCDIMKQSPVRKTSSDGQGMADKVPN